MIEIVLIIGLSGCGSDSDDNVQVTDIPKLNENLKVIKIPIITDKELNE